MPQSRSLEPTVYTITVQGRLSVDWSDYLGGLMIAINLQERPLTTTLSGSLIDQAALVGVINNLYNLGFPILSIEQQTLHNKEKNYV